MTTTPAQPNQPQIQLWRHLKYGLVNAQMLKALLHAAKTTGVAK